MTLCMNADKEQTGSKTELHTLELWIVLLVCVRFIIKSGCFHAHIRVDSYLTAAGSGAFLGGSSPHHSFGVGNNWLRGNGCNRRSVGGTLCDVGGALSYVGGVLMWQRSLRFG